MDLDVLRWRAAPRARPSRLRLARGCRLTAMGLARCIVRDHGTMAVTAIPPTIFAIGRDAAPSRALATEVFIMR